MKFMIDDNENIVISASAKELLQFPDFYCYLFFPNVRNMQNSIYRLRQLLDDVNKIIKQGSASPAPAVPTARDDS